MTAQATDRLRLVVEADGGSRGNPGVAGYGALVRDATSGALLAELAAPLGQASNNVAEYTGLREGLDAVLAIAGDRAADVRVRMDSKLVVEQMSGRWKIKHEDMRRLALQCRDLCRRIESLGGSVGFEWIPRERNKDADALSNTGMDGETVRRFHNKSTSTKSQDPDPDTEQATESQTVAVQSRKPLRLLLAQPPEDGTLDANVVGGIDGVVGRAPRVVAPDGGRERELATRLEADLDATLVVDTAWSADTPSRGLDADVVAAFERLVIEGGTVVVVTSRLGVVCVLATVLGLASDRLFALATAPGSLSAVEVWEDGTASVAFTNRTAHLR